MHAKAEGDWARRASDDRGFRLQGSPACGIEPTQQGVGDLAPFFNSSRPRGRPGRGHSPDQKVSAAGDRL